MPLSDWEEVPTPIIKDCIKDCDKKRLTSINIENVILNPDFDPDVTYYTASVSNNIEKVKVTNRDDLIVRVNGKELQKDESIDVNLNVGSNTITLSVKGGLTYEVNVVREGNTTNKLNSIGIENITLNPNFDPDITYYTGSASNSITKIEVANKSNNIVSVNGSELQKNESIDVNLNVGSNTITLSVKDGLTYRVDVICNS